MANQETQETPQELQFVPLAINLVEEQAPAPDPDELAVLDLDRIVDVAVTVAAANTAHASHRLPKGAFALLAGAAVFLAGCSGSGQAAPTSPATVTVTAGPTSAPATSSAPKTSAEPSPTVPAGPEVTIDPVDGTPIFLVSEFAGHPEALARAVIGQGWDAWAAAGCTLENLQTALSSNQGVDAIPNAATQISQDNRLPFANEMYVSGWEQHPDLMASVDGATKNNRTQIIGFMMTANNQNTPNPNGLNSAWVQPQDNGNHLPALHETNTVDSLSVISQSPDGSFTVSDTVTVSNNRGETLINLRDTVKTHPDEVRHTGGTITFVEEIDANGRNVYKISAITASGTSDSTSVGQGE